MEARPTAAAAARRNPSVPLIATRKAAAKLWNDHAVITCIAVSETAQPRTTKLFASARWRILAPCAIAAPCHAYSGQGQPRLLVYSQNTFSLTHRPPLQSSGDLPAERLCGDRTGIVPRERGSINHGAQCDSRPYESKPAGTQRHVTDPAILDASLLSIPPASGTLWWARTGPPQTLLRVSQVRAYMYIGKA